MIKTTMLGAAPQIADPAENTASANVRTNFLPKISASFPNLQ
jgi:hypothetical protein